MAKSLNKYKTITSTLLNERPSYDLTSDENTKVNTIISNFFTYFETKHS